MSEHGGDRRARRAHVEGEDEEGIERDVGQSPRELHGHGKSRPAHGAKLSFGDQKDELSEGKDETDAEIGLTEFADARVLGAEVEISAPEEDEKSEDEKGEIKAEHEEISVPRGCCRLFPVLFAERAGEQGVDADARAHAARDEQHLDGIGVAERLQRFGAFGQHADEYAVHDVVERLNHHRQHEGEGHSEQEPEDGGFRHFAAA